MQTLPASASPISYIPLEIFEKISTTLSFGDVKSLGKTCKIFHEYSVSVLKRSLRKYPIHLLCMVTLVKTLKGDIVRDIVAKAFIGTIIRKDRLSMITDSSTLTVKCSEDLTGSTIRLVANKPNHRLLQNEFIEVIFGNEIDPDILWDILTWEKPMYFGYRKTSQRLTPILRSIKSELSDYMIYPSVSYRREGCSTPNETKPETTRVRSSMAFDLTSEFFDDK